MQTFKELARSAKRRMKGNFWQESRERIRFSEDRAIERGENAIEAKNFTHESITRVIRGEAEDEFYLKVKELLDSVGEVSDILGRLTDKEYYESLSYEEKTRYNLKLSADYLKALELYKRRKQFTD